MKTIMIEIDDAYADVLSITASGRVGSTLNVTVAAVDLHRDNKVKIDEKGKAWFGHVNAELKKKYTESEKDNG